jgi:hypothetical protein
VAFVARQSFVRNRQRFVELQLVSLAVVTRIERLTVLIESFSKWLFDASDSLLPLFHFDDMST